MSTLTAEEMELFGMTPPALVETRCDAGHSAGKHAPGTRVAMADCARCQELGIGQPDEPAVLPPDAPVNDAALPAPVKRGRKPKAKPDCIHNMVHEGPCSEQPSARLPDPVAAPAPVVYTTPEQPNLRDQFALAALNGLLASGVPQNDGLAVRAFGIADAMMKAR